MILKPLGDYERLIFVHGVSKNPIDTDWLRGKIAKAAGVPTEKIVIFEYEHLLEETKSSKFAMLAARAGALIVQAKTGINASVLFNEAADRGVDAWLIANPFMNGTRTKVVSALQEILSTSTNDLLIGFSNGSVVARLAMEPLINSGKLDVLTIGSPLHLKVYESCLGIKNSPLFDNWVNLYSKWRDPVGYAKIPEKLGCSKKNQFMVKSEHNPEIYLKQLLLLQENT